VRLSLIDDEELFRPDVVRARGRADEFRPAPEAVTERLRRQPAEFVAPTTKLLVDCDYGHRAYPKRKIFKPRGNLRVRNSARANEKVESRTPDE
jgi:hypothetical protein